MTATERRADITEQYGPGHRLAEPTSDLQSIAQDVAEGDHVGVEYVSSGGLETNASGAVSEVLRTRDSVDVRFGDGCYLHVNPRTGDYYFQDRGRVSPENGFQVTAVEWGPR